MRRQALAAAAMAVIVGGVVHAPAAGAADTALRGGDASYVSAYDGDVVWTEPTAGARWRLAGRIDGALRFLPAGTSSGLLSADLGPGAHDATRAVLQRCSYGPRCDLYRIDLPDGRMHRLGALSSRRMAEVAPSGWRGAYVFGRIAPGESQSGHSRRGGLFVAPPGRGPVRWSSRVPQSTDVQGTRLVYSWWSDRLDRAAILSTTTRSRRTCTIDVARGTRYVTAPTIDGDRVYWLRVDGVTGEARIARRRLPDARCRRQGPLQVSARRLPRPAGREEGGVEGLAVDRGTVFYSGLGVFRADDPPPFPGG